MKILLPKHYGFCNGVSSAVNKALAVGSKAYCLGQLVHNKSVSDKLAAAGIVTVDSVDEVPCGATMIIRAHGAPPAVYEQARSRNIKIVDATCPSVRAIQLKAKRYHEDGYTVVLVGDANHPEIIGVNGWCDNSAIIFDGKGKLHLDDTEKALIMFQTTFDSRFFKKSLENISTDRLKIVEIFNTICYTTLQRQYYAQALSSECDLAVVVGDLNSSNTRRLFDIASHNCKTVLTDGSACDFDFSNCKKACIISGASTPSELIKGVLERMMDNAKDTVVTQTVETEQDESAVKAEVKAMDKNEAMLAKAVSELKEGHRYKLNQKVRCRVVLISDDGVYVRIPSSKKEAFIPNEELAMDGDYRAVKAALAVDDVLDCAVISLDKGITLSKKVIDERYKDDALIEGIKQGNEFQVVMTRVGKDCLTGKLGSYTVVVHAAQIKLNGFVKNLEDYVGKTLRLVVTNPEKVDERKHVIYASQKAILLAEKKIKENEFWENIAEGEIVEGKVLRFAPFGAFVDVNGFDCLAHNSDLSWDRYVKPEEVLEIGKVYEFAVIALDREKGRVSLSYKLLQPKPWELAAEKFPVGSVVKGKVARIVSYGAFIELDKHIDGLLHVSNVSWEWLNSINDVLKVGDEIEVQVLEFDAANERITLSRKALLPKPEQVADKKVTE